ncbi:MAG: phosphoribosylformylglycinamidine synthase subunit PurL [Oligoflexia bacterium]|nr:phosphoribosylformylglycinamidine synthase subunit PurL [Oligoflexia bacterium]
MKDFNKLLKHYRLSLSEYELIKKSLGRDLKPIEWPLFSALWSEHCSYKSTRVHLKNLYTKNKCVLQGPGENAGVIDIGMGEKVAFKMESHNHPSFIEPTQGAATGVGGILRDIFTMGARPMASMNYLCFGASNNNLTPKLLTNVVKGIGGYGNCVGVPTVNGQTTFHESYNNNILVNAFSLGLYQKGEEIFYGKASGAGNLIVYAGAATGRDGVHGAAMASESFDEDSEKKKPNVQIGDPFFEKLLIEACLEVMHKNLVVGLQDMGAAGLTSSTFEMASRAGTGLKIDLKKIPLREPDITPEEILLSESQERMVLIVEPKNINEVIKVFKKWDLECSEIGEITNGHLVELYWGDELLTEISHKPLVDEAPKYNRAFKKPEPSPVEEINIKLKNDVKTEVLKLLSHHHLTTREWIYTQYDQQVGAKTMYACDDYVAQLVLPQTERVLGMALGCRPLMMQWDVSCGAKDSIILPVLQMASRGVKALAVTDCLNFGNPEKEKIMGQFVEALESMNEACRQFDTPVISGNVSLYNETLGENIIPTPATAVVGIKEKVNTFPKPYVEKEGLEIYLVGLKDEKLWQGEWNYLNGMKPKGEGFVNLKDCVSLQKCFLQLSEFTSASQVIGRLGLLRALARLTEKDHKNLNEKDLGVGLEINFNEEGRGEETSLFCERFYSALWCVEPRYSEKLEKIVLEHKNLKFKKIGISKGSTLKFNEHFEINLKDLNNALKRGLSEITLE